MFQVFMVHGFSAVVLLLPQSVSFPFGVCLDWNSLVDRPSVYLNTVKNTTTIFICLTGDQPLKRHVCRSGFKGILPYEERIYMHSCLLQTSRMCNHLNFVFSVLSSSQKSVFLLYNFTLLKESRLRCSVIKRKSYFLSFLLWKSKLWST